VWRTDEDSGSVRIGFKSGSIICSSASFSYIASIPVVNGGSIFSFVLALVINERICTFGIANSSSVSLMCFVAV